MFNDTHKTSSSAVLTSYYSSRYKAYIQTYSRTQVRELHIYWDQG